MQAGEYNDDLNVEYQRTGLLFLGDASAPDTNLGTVSSATVSGRTDAGTEAIASTPDINAQVQSYLNTNNTPVTDLPTDVFVEHPKSQIRLFGCYGAVGTSGNSSE